MADTSWPAVPRRRLAWLWLATFALYALTSRGYFQSIDVVETFLVAINALGGHGVSLYSQGYFPGWPVRGVGGQYFAPHAIGQSLLYIPFALLYTSHLLSLGLAHWVATFLDPAIGATLVVVVTTFAYDLVPRWNTALATGLATGVTTMVWPYASVAFDVLPTALALLVAGWQLHRAYVRNEPTHLFWMALALAAALLERVDAGLWVLGIGAVIAVDVIVHRPTWRRWALVALAPLALAVLLTAWYNIVRFGSIWNDGHASDPNFAGANSPWLGGLSLLVSPGKGLLEYSPPLIVAIMGWPRWCRVAPRVAGVTLGGLLGTVALIGTHRDWFGGQSWGPRFLLPALPLLCIPLVYVFSSWSTKARWQRILASVVFLAGFLVQLAGATSGPAQLNLPLTGPTTSPAWHNWLPLSALHQLFSRLGWLLTHGSFVLTRPNATFDVWWLLPPGAATPDTGVRAAWLLVLVGTGTWASWQLWRSRIEEPPTLD